VYFITDTGNIRSAYNETYYFTAGGSGGAVSPTLLSSICSREGLYIVVIRGAGSASTYSGLLTNSGGVYILSAISSHQVDGYSVAFTLNGTNTAVQWNYRVLPSSIWPVSYRIVPLLTI